RREKEAHQFITRHVALVCHPAGHLAPEAVVVFVFDTLAPAPRPVGAHEEDLSGTVGFCHYEGNAPEAIRLGAVRRQNLGSGPGPDHPRIPLETGERGPEIRVGVFGVFETGEETAGTEFGQFELAWR